MSEDTEAPELRELSPRERTFVERVLAGDDGTTAVVTAGWSEKSAKYQARDLMKRPHILAALEEGWTERAREAGYGQRRIQLELAAIMFARVSDFDVDADGTVSVKAGRPAWLLGAVSGVKWKNYTYVEHGVKLSGLRPEITFWDKNTALRNAGVNLGMFVERTATAETTLDDLLREAARGDDDD